MSSFQPKKNQWSKKKKKTRLIRSKKNSMGHISYRKMIPLIVNKTYSLNFYGKESFH